MSRTGFLYNIGRSLLLWICDDCLKISLLGITTSFKYLLPLPWPQVPRISRTSHSAIFPSLVQWRMGRMRNMSAHPVFDQKSVKLPPGYLLAALNQISQTERRARNRRATASNERKTLESKQPQKSHQLKIKLQLSK